MTLCTGGGALPEWLRFTPQELANQVAASVKQTGKRKLTKELTSMAGLAASKVAAGPAGKMVADAAAAVSTVTTHQSCRPDQSRSSKCNDFFWHWQM